MLTLPNKHRYILLLFILLPQSYSHAQNSIERSSNPNYERLYPTISNEVKESEKVDSVLKIIDLTKKTLYQAYKNLDCKKVYINSLQLGKYYQKQYRYDLATEVYFQALKICDSIGTRTEVAWLKHEIGSLYLETRNLNLAYEYLNASLDLKKELDNKKSLAITLNGLALTYWQMGDLNTALSYLFRTLDLEHESENTTGIARTYNNIGIVYHEMNRFEEALSYLNRSLEYKTGSDDNWSIAETLNNIGETYISLGQYDKALSVLTKAQKISSQINELVLLADNYRYLSRLYKHTGNYKEALKYKEHFVAIEDSIFDNRQMGIINELKTSFEVEKRESQLQLHKSRIELLEEKENSSRMKNYMLAISIFALSIIAVTIINRQRRINSRNEKIVEKDIKIQKTQALLVEQERRENQRLEHELELKNKFLVDFALFIGMKNELIYEVKEKIKRIAKEEGASDSLRPIVQQLNQSLRQNKELIEFQKNVEKVNTSFIQKLIEAYPDISENEKQLAIFLRLNISSKEIADFRAVSLKAIEMSRYRLRKKLQLGKDESLRKYIQSI